MKFESLQDHLISLADTKVRSYIFSGTDTDKTPINENLLNIDYNKFVAESVKKDFVISYQGQTFKNDAADASGNTFVALTGEKMIVDPATDKVTYQYAEALENPSGEKANFEKNLSGENL